MAEAHRRAHACDPVSAFGGVIAANRPVSVEMAQQVAEVFTEVIVAPAYEEGAVEVLEAKKNLRMLVAEPDRRGGVDRPGDRRRAAGAGRRPVDADDDRAKAGSWWPGSRAADACWPTWSSPGGRSGG